MSFWNKLGKQYRSDVRAGLNRTSAIKPGPLTEADLTPLPQPVQNYIRYTGAVGKPKVINLKATFDARMRSKKMDWFDCRFEQYNFLDQYERFFYLKAKVKGLPISGYHKYAGGEASMNVKLLSLFTVARAEGEELFKAETVTVLNDICIMAPAALIDKNIRWEPIDDLSAKARFSNRGNTISATLQFNEQGQLVNFVSDDRIEINQMKQLQFSTPLSGYREINGLRLPHRGKAIYHYPEGEFVYGEFELKGLEYNVGR